MKISKFTIVGENIHCTRILKRDGDSIGQASDGSPVIIYEAGGQQRQLPIPELFVNGADWENGRVKRCAAALWQSLNGGDEERRAGDDYIRAMAAAQEKAGAAFIDINVDEFSTNPDERIKAMRRAAALAQEASSLPLSIDSSNGDVMRAGLEACDRARARPLINSVSLERPGLIEMASEHAASVVASASGENSLPETAEDRTANLRILLPQLERTGMDLKSVYIDPLVYTISTNPLNGRIFLESVSALRKEYGADINIIGGLSNISFGMPGRKLINLVFARLCIEHGADGGIVDPLQININTIESLESDSEAFKLARALLMGDDEFGMNFISAYREGKLN